MHTGSCFWITGIFRAFIAVIAILGRAGFAYARITIIARGAEITIVAGRAVGNGCSFAHHYRCSAALLLNTYIVRGTRIIVGTWCTNRLSCAASNNIGHAAAAVHTVIARIADYRRAGAVIGCASVNGAGVVVIALGRHCRCVRTSMGGHVARISGANIVVIALSVGQTTAQLRRMGA